MIDNENLKQEDLRNMLFNYNTKYIKKPILTQIADKRHSKSTLGGRALSRRNVDSTIGSHRARFKDCLIRKDMMPSEYDNTSIKSINRVLKLNTKDGESYYLPKRERFNEHVDKVIDD